MKQHTMEESSFRWKLAAAAAKSLQPCLTLWDPIDGSPPGSPIPGILQARTLEWVAISFSNAWKWKVKVKLLSRVRLSNPIDCSLPGSSVHGIFWQEYWSGVLLPPPRWKLVFDTLESWLLIENILQDFPGGPVAQTLCSQCRRPSSITG